MPHPIQSHQSDEGLMRKFFSIDITKVAARTSSVRLKRRQRPANTESKRSSTQPGCHLISKTRTVDLIDAEAGILHLLNSSQLKIQKPAWSGVSSREQDIEDPVVQRRPGHRYEGKTNSHCSECNRNGVGATTTANRASGSTKLEKQDITCRESLTERPLTDDSNGVAHDTLLECRTALTTSEKQIGVRIKSAEELQQEEWRLVRAAMQVEMDPMQDNCEADPISQDGHRPCRAWKHAEHNFFPSSLQYLDQDEVVRTVLERHLKGGRLRREA
ncbi:hypothetical protein MMC17_006290 [Xylographa soralifera]|nr:hypothetical protein [Xylographa soralifera]